MSRRDWSCCCAHVYSRPYVLIDSLSHRLSMKHTINLLFLFLCFTCMFSSHLSLSWALRLLAWVWLELASPPIWTLFYKVQGSRKTLQVTRFQRGRLWLCKYSLFTYLHLIAFGNFTSKLHLHVFTADRSPQSIKTRFFIQPVFWKCFYFLF